MTPEIAGAPADFATSGNSVQEELLVAGGSPDGPRVRTVTLWLLRVSSRTTAWPTKPVPPVTRTRTTSCFLFGYLPSACALSGLPASKEYAARSCYIDIDHRFGKSNTLSTPRPGARRPLVHVPGEPDVSARLQPSCAADRAVRSGQPSPRLGCYHLVGPRWTADSRSYRTDWEGK